MKLTKKLEAEILKVYKAYWDAYLNGDMKTFASMLDEDITVFGTAVSEVFNNKKETVRFYRATADQLVSKAQFRNRNITVNDVDSNILVNEQSDLYFLMDKKWTFYGHVRVSAIFKHTRTGWKLVHQHASFPDIRAEEGEQIAAEKIKEENLQLRDAVKRRTIELEEKNRELEIETSLEKVRAQALGMHKADELLNVCKVLFKELIALGFTGLRNAIIHSFNDDKAYFTDYDYSDTTGGAITNISYNENPIIKKFIKQIRKSDNAFVQINIKGNELKNWRRFRKKGGQPDDPLLNKASGIHYYLHSIEKASIGISTFNVINEEQLRLLKRFRNVFDFAYRRYMDIAKAEAQTREAQIEVAVERVRAKALAMHRSDEIHEVVRALRNELFGLKLEGIIGATICLKQSDGQIRFWDITDVETTGRYGWDIVFDISKIDPRLWVKKIWDAKKQIISTEQDLSDLKRALKWLGEYDKKTADEILKILKINNIKHGWHRAVRLAHGRLITDFANEPPSEIDSILLKIGVAFDLAYRRFLDLQKAEAQAKEARIELALERVRARAMAMQNSAELAELVSTVFSELNHLDFALTSCIIWIHDHDLSSDTLWIASSEMNRPAEPFKVRPFHKDFFQSIIPAWKAKDPKWVFTLTGPEKKNFEKAFFKELPDLPDALRKALKEPKQVVFSASFNNFGALEIVETKALTDEKFDILHRFGKVFDSSYTRFNDLKKAEAQAREAQIQLALERVRARTMAMHHSEELTDVVKLLYQEFDKLKISNESTDIEIGLINEETGIASVWAHFYLSDGTISTFKLPLTYVEEINNEFNIWKATPVEKRNELFHTTVFSGDLSAKFMRITKDFPELAEIFRPLIEAKIEKWVTHNAYFSHGFLTLQGIEAYPTETQEIQKRFAKVFEQTYTRFLDLQKAEAQAREAQIEAALERVRARTMAMHKSTDLLDVVKTLGEQFKLLGFKFDSVNFNTDYKQKDYNLWLYNSESAMYPGMIHIPYIDHPCFNRVLEAFEKGIDFASFIFTKEEKDSFFDHIYTNSVAKYGSDERKKYTYAAPGMTMSVAVTKNISVTVTNYRAEPFSEEENAIIRRFANVFEQSYTRFLDLQKAEAQAREAQIEAALERVRSRTMAMQKTDELLDAAQLVHKELAALGINSMNVSYAFVDESEKYGSYYSVNPVDDKIVPIPFVFPHTETDVMRSILASWKKQESHNVIELKEKATLKHQTYIGEHIQRQLAKNNVPFSIEEFLKVSPKKAVLSTFNFANGYLFNIGGERLSKTQEELMLRFTRVFEQTYTRFLDLQKAEAQAREAQIEAALERVRSRTMGMQKSDELKEVIQVVYEQFVHLNIHVEHTGFIMDYKKRDDMHIWLADKHAVPFQVTIPYFDCAHWNSFKEAKEKGIDFFANQLSFEEKNRFYQDLFKVIPGVPEETLEYYFSCPGLAISTVLLENVGLYIENFSGIPYTDEEDKILLRFGKVFQQTYTRFLDLQKAEAQAREAQIETALEKVRSHTMGMRSSDDLANVATVMFDQMRILGGDLFSFGIVLCDKHEDMVEQWHGIPHAGMLAPFFVPVDLDYIHRYRYDQWKAGVELFSVVIPEDYISHHFDLMLRLPSVKSVWEGIAAKGIPLPAIPTWEIDYGASFRYGYLLVSALKPFEEDKIFPRFAKVFEQAYTRFLDLQKAEAQAREAEIELGLERVRAKTMAMQKPSEFLEVINVIGEQFIHLGFDIEWVNFGANGLDIAEGIDIWNFAVIPGDNPASSRVFIPFFDHPLFIKAVEELNEYRRTGNDFFIMAFDKYDKDRWLDHLFTKTVYKEVPEEYRAIQYAKPGYTTSNIALKETWLSIGKFDSRSFTDEQHSILRRFANAFGQAHTRFLDLQKAEAQAREAQIELGLERVRARAMAMQNSDELKELIGTVFTELTKLDLVLTRCLIVIFDPKTNGSTWWMANSEAPSDPIGLYVKYHDHPPYLSYVKGWQERNLKWQYILEGKDKKEWDDFLFVETELSHLPDFVIAGMKAPDRVYLNASFNSFGNLTLASLEPLSNEHFDILLRFAKVFDLTYTRFNDLKQAEAQAREAQIELGLERVRARAMAMQKSDELSELVDTVFKELTKLDFALTWCIINIIDEPSMSNTVWAANPDINKAPESYHMLFEDYPFHHAMMRGWRDRKTKDVYVLEGQEKKVYDEYLFNETEFRRVPAAAQAASRAMEKYVVTFSFSNFGGLQTVGDEPLSESNVDILSRFGKVFDLTYTRFNDLRLAESQARESQIQLAMERVRARTMAMQKSDELPEAANLLFQQVQSLGMPAWSAGYCTWDNDKKTSITLSMSSEGVLQPTLSMPLTKDPSLMHFREAWERGESFFVEEVGGEELKTHYTYLRTLPGVKETLDEIEAAGYPVPTFQIFHLAYFSKGFLLFITYEQVPEAHDIFKRFAKVFEQTYTRFLDLKKAEAQAREAQIETALERVRSRTLAMHKSEELAETAVVLFKQMISLGIEPNRLYIAIINDDSGDLEFWITDENGEKVSSRYMVNIHKNISIKKMYEGWAANKKAITIDMQGKELEDWLLYWKEEFHVPFKPVAALKRRVQNIAYFSKGFVAIASPDDQPESTINLLERFAAVFNLTYTRFNDLKIAEAHASQAEEDLVKLHTEKRRTEEALAVLQATQKQLIQSEKMASLGELTAGIAHEIQNPLNFVNNFSEVSNELIEELRIKNEKLKIDDEEINELLNDIAQNLEKINHHGKRADGIVKGMLQHSRTSSGQKEPTDINVLAEEYLRLAYHGLRAKDKSFNAKFETDFDPTIDKIALVQQDIGRVILNLINNAFYAVDEKKRQAQNGYEPTVTINTRKLGDTIEIAVKDNGNGIPKKVLDKIFQPFFTTKPTGQGTGLGLSLAYDIIKTHGGELKVDTEEGKGANFIISIPIIDKR